MCNICRLWKVNFDAGRWWSLKREGLNSYDALVAVGMNPNVAEQVSKHWVAEIESSLWLQLDPILPEATRAVAEARSNGLCPAILTARSSPYGLKSQLHRVGLDLEFEVVSPLGAADQKSAALKRAGADYFIGDTESDAIAAHRSETRFIGVSSGQRSTQFLAKYTSTVVSDVHMAIKLILERESTTIDR